MDSVWDFVLRHGYAFLFAAVFIEQIGAPVPALPVLVAMGALAGLGNYSVTLALLTALVAAILADWAWFELGRRRGSAVLNFLCRISLEPDSCVRSTRSVWDRWGGRTLLISKFVPGLSTVAPPLAGITGMPLGPFLISDAAGSLFWAGGGLGLGYLLRREAGPFLVWLQGIGGWFVVVLGAPLAVWLLWKYAQRRSFFRQLRIARIEPEDLHQRIASGESLVLVDLRSPAEVEETGLTLPGARLLNADEVAARATHLTGFGELIFFCS
jgi:membrane protein DedA with SNARE-associated domain